MSNFLDLLRPPGTPEVHLRLIGYWKERDDDFPDPKRLVDPAWRKSDRARIVGYLKGGSPSQKYYGHSHCRFACGIPNREMGAMDLSDGLWVWPEGLWHYIERHDVVLPDEFVATLEENLFRVPETRPLDVLQWAKIDTTFWTAWAAGRQSSSSRPS